jgi:copper chaperone CopZ
MTHEYQITGMTCGSCVARVKNELLKLGDVTGAEVQLSSPQAVISMSKHISTSLLQQAVSKAGHYTISEAGNHAAHTAVINGEDKPSYLPIFLIFGYIAGISILVQVAKGSFNWMQWMVHFMAGFFFVFSFFKLMNLRGFAEGYQSYDVVAKKFPAWGFIYAFIELGLGIAFLTGIEPLIVNAVTLVVMAVSTVGVVQSLLRKTNFQCACLGTVIQLPLSKVTLLEDLLMVAMSGTMLATML